MDNLEFDKEYTIILEGSTLPTLQSANFKQIMSQHYLTRSSLTTVI